MSSSSEDPTGFFANLIASTWNWLAPYRDVEITKNFNKLKSGFDALHFQGRDTVVWVGGSLLWILLHLLLWDGRVNTMEDLSASLLSPGVKVDLPSHQDLGEILGQSEDNTQLRPDLPGEAVELPLQPRHLHQEPLHQRPLRKVSL